MALPQPDGLQAGIGAGDGFDAPTRGAMIAFDTSVPPQDGQDRPSAF
ncbi:protein of unknown function (plasmid) [Azospirillum baldaniorum]|uniref:Uncharacterized protein n=1 Tax=Azospirillum baldaniorum TaxID=1064539 RepID=A0A9P1JUV7_9PROT|nr:protein of unknown function [Azospirillum baldaniorum]